MYTERLNYLDKQLSFSKFVGTQTLQVIENINYLIDCHAGGRGFESRPLRRLIKSPDHSIRWVRCEKAIMCFKHATAMLSGLKRAPR